MEPLEERQVLSVVLHVDADAEPGGSGATWDTAYDDLQSAFNAAAVPGADVREIWIAEGSYTPSVLLEGGDPRSASFSLLDGVDLYGGFAGTETTLDARDWSTHVTTLSGDLGTLDDNSDNAYTVVYGGESVTTGVGIDGISITGGNADGASDSGHPERSRGGGIFTAGTLTVTNSMLSGNSAEYDGGGGIYNSGTLAVTNSALVGNSVYLYGGGIGNSGTLTVTNSTLAGNSALEYGGGIFSGDSGTLTVNNSIVSVNTGQNILGSLTSSNNLVNVDPGFVHAPSAGVDGVWGTADDDLGNLQLEGTSPAINAGSNPLAAGTTDLAGAARIADDTVDIGAHEYQGSPDVDRETASLVVTATHDNFDLYDGEITLREAIYYSRSGIGGTVTFDAGLNGETITLGGEDLWIGHTVGIDASALASSIIVNAATLSRAFYISGDVTLLGLMITGGLNNGGGGICNVGTLAVTNSTVFGNTAEYDGGGGIYNAGTLTVTGSTLSGNEAESDGGGGIYNLGMLTVSGSTLLSNATDSNGGGIYNAGTLTVSGATLKKNDSTFRSGGGIFNAHDSTATVTGTFFDRNSAGEFGGGIYNWGNSANDSGVGTFSDGELTVTTSTLSGNSASEYGGGGYNAGTLTLTNSLISGNSAIGGGGVYNDFDSTLTLANATLSGNSANSGSELFNGYSGTLTLANSIVYSTSGDSIQGRFHGSNSLIDIDPHFGTAFHLTNISPAVNAGSNAAAVDAAGNPLTTDLDGNVRIMYGTVDMGAYELQTEAPDRETPSLVVTVAEDEFDLFDGDVTLREAIYYAQFGIGGTVTFDASLAGATITLAGNELLIHDSIVVDASALSSLTVNANNGSRAFHITDDVTLKGLTITGGLADNGGGIYNSGGLTIDNSTVSGNSATADGGGIYNYSGTLTVTDSTVLDNTAADDGGGIYNRDPGTLTVMNSTLSGNSAGGDDGGGIYNYYGTLWLINSALAGNSATDDGGGIYNYSGMATVTNSTLSGNSAADVCGGIFTNDSGTLTVNNSIVYLNTGENIHGGFDQSHSLIGTDPLFVRAPSPGADGNWGTADDDLGDLHITGKSSAINAGSNPLAVDAAGNSLTADLDGNPRIYDYPVVPNLTVDIGAYELQSPPDSGRETPSLIVSVADDEFDLYDGDITLREAIYYSQSGTSGTVTFDAGLDGATITLAGAELLIGHAMVIDASALSSVIVDAAGLNRVFYITNDVEIIGLTITGGAAEGNGGGIFNSGALTLSNSTLNGNSAVGGGGIYNSGTLNVTNSTLSGNRASNGGGIFNSGTLTLTNSTLSGNAADGDGGGVYSSGTATVTGSLLATNMASQGEGGGVFNSGTLTVMNSTLSGNSASTGGGIYSDNNSSAMVTSSTLSGNSALAGVAGATGVPNGGGIFNSGTLTVTNSTLSGNRADADGGGIHNSGTLTVTNSTLSGNTADADGGGIHNSGTLTVTNSTLSGNTADADGGGIHSSGTLTLMNSTLSENFALSDGGGVYNSGSSLTATLNNTILAGNGASSGPDILISSGTLSGAHNLIGDGSGQSTLFNGLAGNQVGNSSSPIDPRLSDLTEFDNGLSGYVPLFASPVIDAGSNALLPNDTYDLDNDADTTEPLPLDLAGNPRVSGQALDIGAVQFALPEQFLVMWHSPQGEFLPGQTEISLFFSRELTTMTTDDLVLVGPDGALPVTSVSRTQHMDGWSEYAVGFDPLRRGGAYQLSVSPIVQDTEGGSLDQDVDNIAGELEEDWYVASWLLAGSRVESHEPSGTLWSFWPLAHLDLTFSSAMDQTSFSLDDIQALTGPNGAISPTGYDWLDDQTLRVMFQPVGTDGTVSITIGTEVFSQSGDALDQNQNGVAGEGDDTWTGSVTRVISETIDRDTVIPSSAGQVVINSTITIAAGATLTIEPGVTLKFASGARMDVYGQLVAQGTVGQPVVFTSSDDLLSAWTGIRVRGTGTINLDHAEVRHADKAVDADFEGAHVVLNNTILRDGGFGVYVYSPYVEVIAENCLIANNAKTGIFVRADSRHSFKNCTIVGNGFGDSSWNEAGIHVGGSILTLENCIVAFNNTAGLHHAMFADPPAVTVRNSIFHNPAGPEIIWDGDPGMPDLGANGNMTVDPLFVDHANGDYQLAVGSPAVDSGTGFHAPATDLLDRSRHDDRGMPNVGTGHPSYVDIGAYERQTDSPMADLAVTYVSHPDPEVVTVGDTFNLQWTVGNVGAVDTSRTWQDLVYLSNDPYLGGGDQLLATVDHTDPLAPGASYTEDRTFTVPDTSGPKYILVRTQLVGIPRHEAVETNNLGVSARVLAVDVPLLELGTPLAVTSNTGNWKYFRFEAEAGRTVLFDISDEINSSIYLRRSLPPTLSDNEVVSSHWPDQEVRLLDPVEDTYYVGVFSGGLYYTTYTLWADLTTLDIREVAPSEIGNAGTATIKILGDDFGPDAEAQLVGPGGAVIEGNEYRQDSATLFGTFDLAAAGAAPGLYNVVVTNPGLGSVTAYDAVTVSDGGVPTTFHTSTSMPGTVRPGRVVDLLIDYTNTSTIDVISPILTLHSDLVGVEWRLPGQDEWFANPYFATAVLSSDGPPTILRPGQTESLVVEMHVPFQRQDGCWWAMSDYFSVDLSSGGYLQDRDLFRVKTSYTPEDKYGPAGYDAPGTPAGSEVRYVPEDQQFEYRVDFWNRPDAEVPTQDAIIIDTLDPALFDLSTLRITNVGFLKWSEDITSGAVVDTRIDAMPDMNIAVEIKAGLGMQIPLFANNADIDANTLVFWFHTIDPATGEWPTDPMDGFLPPFNPETGFEIGWFEFTVDPVADLTTGTQLTNAAYVEFDFAGDIYDHPAPKVDPDAEPAVAAPWTNTVDAVAPTSQVESLPPITGNEVLTVRWNGQDDTGGSGIASYDIFVATDTDPFVLWLNDTTDTETLFPGSADHEYAFYSRATDNVGHREAAPLTPDAHATINPLPTADPGGPYSVAEGGSVALDASASVNPQDADNSTLIYEWDLDYDGNTFDVDATGMSPNFSASTIDGPKTRVIGLQATDEDGLSHIATTTVEVTNVGPTATITGSLTSSPEAVGIVLGGSATDPAPADTAAGFAYSWDVTKDGAAYTSGTSATFGFTPNDDGSYQVSLTATDKNGGISAPATATIEVANVAPTIVLTGNDTVDEGETYTLTLGAITDPGTDTVTQWTVNWGDGQSNTYAGGGDQTHVYQNDGAFTITVDLTDEDGTHTGTGSLDLTVNPAGPVDFQLREHLSLAAGSLYYPAEAAHDGFLSLQVDVPLPPKSARLKLYGADPVQTPGITPLAQSSLDEDGNQRIDWPTVAGTVYYVEVYGGNVDFNLRIANLLHHNASNSIVTVHGTDGNDTFHFNAAASRDVTINGVRYHFDDAQVTAVTFNGGDGYDQVVLDDSAGDDTLTAEATHAVFSNAGQTAGFTVTVDGFEELQAYARAGGNDTALLYDSDANDKFKSEPAKNYAKMYGGRMYNRVKFYDVVEAFSTAGKDLARVFDTAGNDTFEGQKDASWMRTDVFDVGLHNFRQVIAYGNEGGRDEAFLKDSELKDEVHLKSHKSEIFDQPTNGDTYKITARGFDTVHADGTQGAGYDKVKIWDSAHDNRVEAADYWAHVFAQKTELEMIFDILAFEFVKVRASIGGNDTASVTEPLDVNFDLRFEDGWGQ